MRLCEHLGKSLQEVLELSSVEITLWIAHEKEHGLLGSQRKSVEAGYQTMWLGSLLSHSRKPLKLDKVLPFPCSYVNGDSSYVPATKENLERFFRRIEQAGERAQDG